MTHRQKELTEMLLRQAGYKEEGRMYVNHSVPSAIGIKEIFPDGVDDSELWESVWDEASEHIDDDLFSLGRVAGSCVITSSEFKKLADKYKLSRK